LEKVKEEDQGKDGLMRSSLFWDITHRTLVVTDVSEQPIGPIFKGQAVRCLNLEDGNDKLSRNVGN
jgi:hypothetical protein